MHYDYLIVGADPRLMERENLDAEKAAEQSAEAAEKAE